VWAYPWSNYYDIAMCILISSLNPNSIWIGPL
jgi:hypothetical protein